MLKVKDLMTKDVRVCSPDDSLNQAAKLMWDHCCGTVVVTADSRKIVGIITDRDVCMGAYTKDRPLTEIPVAASMTTEVRTCGPDDAISRAEEMMQVGGFRRLPVVDAEGSLVGVVSLTDIARELAREVREGQRQMDVDPSELGRTLAALSLSGGPPRSILH